MNDYKFRGKRIDNGEWVCGDLRQDKDLKTAYIQGFDYYTDEEGSQREPFEYQVIPETVGQFTEVTDKNNLEISENHRVKVCWLAELGITELDCEVVGTVKYKPETASFNVVFDKPYIWHCEEGVYEETEIQLIQATEDMAISFEIIDNSELM